MSSDAPILVVGATGKQGGVVVKGLLEKGLKVRGVTRNVDSSKSKALKEQGVEMVQGDLGHPGTITQASQGVSAAFLMTTPFEGGEEAEMKQGMAGVDALKAANVPHIVFSSVADAHNKTGVPHFESKFKVEEYLKASGLPYTITAPVYFMENFVSPWNLGALKQGIYGMALSPEKKLQQASVRTIGQINAEVLSNPSKYAGRRIDYADDELTGEEAVAILTKVTGKDFKYVQKDIEQLRAQSEDMALMFDFFERTGYTADLVALKEEFPGVQWQSFEEWATAQDWDTLLKE